MKYKFTVKVVTYVQLSLFCILISCSQKVLKVDSDFENQNEAVGKYLGMTPTNIPVLLAPQIIASSLQEYNGTFNPEGTEFFFTTNTPTKGIICYTKMDKDNKWTKPRIAEFSGGFSEYDPIFSPDGSKMYFSSERPTPDNKENTQSNIWYVEKTDDSWSMPIYLDLNRNGNYYSSITSNGSIYFNMWNDGDMYKASPTIEGYTVEKLDSILNTPNGEGDPFISPKEDYLIFRGYNNSLGNGDLYISFRIDNEWTKPENLGTPINSKYHEMCPYVTVDGKFFVFSSSRLIKNYNTNSNSDLNDLRAKHTSFDNGELNVFYISTDFISEMRNTHLKEN